MQGKAISTGDGDTDLIGGKKSGCDQASKVLRSAHEHVFGWQGVFQKHNAITSLRPSILTSVGPLGVTRPCPRERGEEGARRPRRSMWWVATGTLPDGAKKTSDVRDSCPLSG